MFVPLLLLSTALLGEELDPLPVDFQPLSAQVVRVVEALETLGAPIPQPVVLALTRARVAKDSAALQRALDPLVVCLVEINPELRVKARRGPAAASIQQGGFTPVLLKVSNLSAAPRKLNVSSPQAGQVFGGMSRLSAQRLQRVERRETEDPVGDPSRFLALELAVGPPLADRLSGLGVEYAVLLVYCRDAGKLEATLAFDVGQGTQDLGFRAEVPVLFEARPAVAVQIDIFDVDGKPTTGRLLFRDENGRVVPPPAKRLAPDFYFQEHIYRRSGSEVLLPPGNIVLEYGRGPEYRVFSRTVEVKPRWTPPVELHLARWVDPSAHGFYSGDHHIHGAGCAHYTSPTEGVTPEDMFQQVAGEGLNVGCVLTWGPCFDYQRKFFSPGVHQLSSPLTLLKYDLEISGFGSEALGHVCLLNLSDQVYPGSGGTKTRGWPSWTAPVLRWARAQGAVVGYAHSGSGLEIDASAASQRLLARLDTNKDGVLSSVEAANGLLPLGFERMDLDRDGGLVRDEVVAAHDTAAGELPNFAVPEMDGVGAMETCVTVAAGLCDFMSSMDTPRIAEWNLWYHVLNCGFPLKLSGETDFPCMSGDRVGQGRVYVQLGRIERIDFGAWCAALKAGRSYVSDGFAHALELTVNGVAPGAGQVTLDEPSNIRVHALVAFAPSTPRTVAQGLAAAPGGRRWAGDTVNLHLPRTPEHLRGGTRVVEIVVNGKVVAERVIEADGISHAFDLELAVPRSSWVALRQFPELHTNPVEIIIAGQPVRASRQSALWCIEVIEQLWRKRNGQIDEDERREARRLYDAAIATYRERAAQSATE